MFFYPSLIHTAVLILANMMFQSKFLLPIFKSAVLFFGNRYKKNKQKTVLKPTGAGDKLKRCPINKNTCHNVFMVMYSWCSMKT